MPTRPYVWGGLAAAILAATLSLAWASPQDRSDRTFTHRWVQEFGMVTPSHGQTLRLHVVNLGLAAPPEPDAPGEVPPPDPDVPPDPCRVTLVFYDSAGEVLGFLKNQELRTGKATLFDHNFELPTTNAVPPGPCRATVWITQTSRHREIPPGPCKATLELLDTTSGRTAVHMPPAVERRGDGRQ